jgi:hypothetical protein
LLVSCQYKANRRRPRPNRLIFHFARTTLDACDALSYSRSGWRNLASKKFAPLAREMMVRVEIGFYGTGGVTKKTVSDDVNLLSGSYIRVRLILSIVCHVNSGTRYRLIVENSI